MRSGAPLGVVLLAFGMTMLLPTGVSGGGGNDGICFTPPPNVGVDPSCTIGNAKQTVEDLHAAVCEIVGKPANETCFWPWLTDTTRALGDLARDLGRPSDNVPPLLP